MKARCCEVGCTKLAKARHRRCAGHAMRRWRAAHPVTAQYARLKAKARRRGIFFGVTRAEWVEFCAASGYADGVGCDWPGALQVDRKRRSEGYTLGNMQVLTFAENRAKEVWELAGAALVEGPF